MPASSWGNCSHLYLLAEEAVLDISRAGEHLVIVLIGSRMLTSPKDSKWTGIFNHTFVSEVTDEVTGVIL